MTGMLTLTEDETFYFDAEAGERPIRFIEKFCTHQTGRQHAGKPFLLTDEQKQIIRDVFGWKRRSDGTRRFTDVYFEAAIGAGKSPLLAAVGIYCLSQDGERGAEVYSLASAYGQARIIFDCAKKMIETSTALAPHFDIVDREIRHKASKSVWKIVSGKGPGSGTNASAIFADECHDWQGPNAYNDIRDRTTKRTQPLSFVVTNSGKSRAIFCWTLREKAVAALEGKGDPSIYPVIWKAKDEAETDDRSAWRDANPLIGVTISEDKIARKCREAMKDEHEETEFRRLYLSIWPTTAVGRWLDLSLFDAAVSPFDAKPDSPLYLGLDLSMGDDLCSAAPVWPTPDRMFIGSHFWMPATTASKYETKDGTPYAKWAAAGYLTLLKQSTIDAAASDQIAGYVIGLSKRFKLKAVCYDPAYASRTIAIIESAGLPCMPVRQGYSVSPGCNEFARRLVDGSVTIAPNDVLRFCAENVEVTQDRRGNIWPVKPNAKGKYAGKRNLKIDGISAVVTALTEALKFDFPTARPFVYGSLKSA